MIEIFSPTWLAIKAYIDKELPQATADLETPGLGIAETENARGRIKMLRGLLDLSAPKKPIDIGHSQPVDPRAGF